MSEEKAGYMADDNDLPVTFFDQPGNPNPVLTARERIRFAAEDLGIEVAEAEVQTFAIILLAVEQTKR